MPENKKINCFLIGVQKAGTSSFYNWLSQHPQINAPKEMKDTHFFSQERYLQKGAAWLESFYTNTNAAPVLLKGAVNYIYFPQVAATIYDYNDESKFILILRDPVKRAFSAYNYMYKLGLEKRSFKQSIEDELQHNFFSEEAKGNFAYLGHGYYYDQLKNWLNYFERNRFSIHIYETLFQEPQKALQETFEFLGIDKNFTPNLVNENTTGVVKYRWINNLFFTHPQLIKALKKIHVDKVIGYSARVNFLNWLRDWNTSSKKKPGDRLTPEMYAALYKHFEDDISGLSQLLQTNLKTLWKY
ncbi:sulfotransferase family protein [Parafilimonas sp.]|uniref:sulfotransferase family protein n=1 Tax=Parafilimonas sp. TaxID=1969739 RepID=UPI003F7CDC36